MHPSLRQGSPHTPQRSLPMLLLLLIGIVSLTACDKKFPPVTMPKEIAPLSDDTLQKTIASSSAYLLVHFTSYDPNCGFCVDSNPYTDDLAKKYTSTLKVARIHWEPWTDYSDRSGQIKMQFSIRGIPLYVLYKDGQEVWRGYGYTHENIRKLEQQLETCCAQL